MKNWPKCQSIVIRSLSIVAFMAGCIPAAQPPKPTSLPAKTSAPTQIVEPTITPTSPPTSTPTAIASPTPYFEFPYQNPALDIDTRLADLLGRMSLEEKIGQMTQPEKDSIPYTDVNKYFIGSVLSGGGGSPSENTVLGWANMTDTFQKFALETPLGIPLIYGVDAVHGHNNLHGATIFPHNIGLGAADDPELMVRIGKATAAEMLATGAFWNFAPVLAAPQDIRWGRTYEGYSEDPEIVTRLGAAYLRGLQGADDGGLSSPGSVLGTPKHFLGDGATEFGSSKTGSYLLDQGDMRVDETALRRLYLPPYQAAVENGAMSIMVSFSSWRGTKMHAQKYLLTDVLKGELSFPGFLISDWQGIDQIPGDYYEDVVTSINAGLDMIMVPYDYKLFITTLLQAVQAGDVPMQRIDDAVNRILRAKFALGLFERPYADLGRVEQVGSEAHRLLAAEAVHKSLVLLKNENNMLPISEDTQLIFVAGIGADDIGLQCGGWSLTWQGEAGSITPGSTILQGIKTIASGGTVLYSPYGRFDKALDSDGKLRTASVGIVVVAEEPYAEGQGDRPGLALSARDISLIERVRPRVDKLVLVVISGRPMVLGEALPLVDAVVAAWLPGSEGAAVADALFGKAPFVGKLPYAWPRTNEQLPLGVRLPAGDQPSMDCAEPLFPRGYGLSEDDPSPTIPNCR